MLVFSLFSPENNTQVLRSDLPAPGFFNTYVDVSDLSGTRLPEDLEIQPIRVTFHTETSLSHSVVIHGRKGMNDWYEEHVGYRLDDDNGEPLKITDLVAQVVEMMFYHLTGVDGPDVQEPALDFEAVSFADLMQSAQQPDIDAALAPLQQQVGITSGDVAAIFFSDEVGDKWPILKQEERVIHLSAYLMQEAWVQSQREPTAVAGHRQPKQKNVVFANQLDQQQETDAGREFFIYSASESTANQAPMFWAEGEGWCDLLMASSYSRDMRDQTELPVSIDNDAVWVTREEAFKLGGPLQREEHAYTALDLTLSAAQSQAVTACIQEMIDSGERNQDTHLGTTLMLMLKASYADNPERQRTLHLTLEQLAYLYACLRSGKRTFSLEMLSGDQCVSEAPTLLPEVENLIRRIEQERTHWTVSGDANFYTHKFDCRCPVNDQIIHYTLEIEAKEMIQVEDIVAAAKATRCGFHENLAEMFFTRFGGNQRLSAYHHGVNIVTIRKTTHTLF